MVQNIIKLTYRNRKKIADMCVALLPKVGYARVTHSGTIILKKSFWSLSRKRIPVTDIVIKYIPIEIGKLICTKADRDVYVSLFNYRVATIVSLTKHVEHLDLLNHVYKEYLKTCMIVEPEEDVILSYKDPIIAKTQLFNMKALFKHSKMPIGHKHSLFAKVEKLRSKLPVFHSVLIVTN